jgi:hypothetical protein
MEAAALERVLLAQSGGAMHGQTPNRRTPVDVAWMRCHVRSRLASIIN